MFHQYFLLLLYNRNVVCIIDKGKEPICEILPANYRKTNIKIKNIPLHDPYIPRKKSLFYNCSSLECKSLQLYSITQLSSPNLILKSCFQQQPESYECETIRYNYFKNIDKLLFLTKNIKNNKFYLVDCLIYADGGRVCHKQEETDSHLKLVDTGAIARPKEKNVLSQDDFLCEESENKNVNCDPNLYIPFSSGLKVKESVNVVGDILLKTGSFLVLLKHRCVDSWCGYSGHISTTRRSRYSYKPPGKKVYRCYYAKKQQICKEVYGDEKPMYNKRGWLST